MQCYESGWTCAEDRARYEKDLEAHPEARGKAERKTKKKAATTGDGAIKAKARACTLSAAVVHCLVPLLWSDN